MASYSPVQYISGSAGLSIQVEGLTETIAMLEEFPKALVVMGFTAAFQAAGNVFKEAVDAKVPIRLGIEEGDLVVNGGDLKAALMSEVTLDSNYRGGMVEVGFGPLGYIANFVEHGHRMASHAKETISGPRTPGGRVRAYPFMRPAFNNSKERAIDAFVSSIADTVMKLKSSWGLPRSA